MSSDLMINLIKLYGMQQYVDKNNDNEISDKELALFTYMPQAKELSNSLFSQDANFDFNQFNTDWNTVKNYGNENNISATAGLMFDLDVNKDGSVTNDEIASLKDNQNAVNLNNIFLNNTNFSTPNFDNFFKYIEIVNTNNDYEVSQDNASSFGALLNSQNGVKLKDSDTTISSADFLSTVQKHVSGAELSEEEQAVVDSLKTGNVEVAQASNNNSETNTIAAPVINGNIVTFGNGKTITIPNGAKAKLSDDGQNVLIETEGQGKCKILHISANGGKTNYYEKLVTTTTYDSKGNAVEEKTLIYDPKIDRTTKKVSYDKFAGSSVITREFNNCGNATKETTQKYNKNGKRTGNKTVVENEYDENGNKTKETTKKYRSTNDQLVSHKFVENKYNDSGNLIEETEGTYSYKTDNLLHTKSKRYDDEGNKTETEYKWYDTKTGEFGGSTLLKDGKQYHTSASGATGVMTYSGNNMIYTNSDGVETIAPKNDSWVSINTDGTLSISGRKYSDGWDCSSCGTKTFPAGSKIIDVSKDGYKYTVQLPDGTTEKVNTKKF